MSKRTQPAKRTIRVGFFSYVDPARRPPHRLPR